MSDEQFDKRLKKRLETYRPLPAPQGWERIRGRLPVPWFVHWFSQYGGWAFGTFATLSLVSVLYLWYDQKQELTQLHERINTLAKQTAQIQLTDRIAMPVRRDTVYVVKRIVEHYERPGLAASNYVPTETPDPTRPGLHLSETPAWTSALRSAEPSRKRPTLPRLVSDRKNQSIVAGMQYESGPAEPVGELSTIPSVSQQSPEQANANGVAQEQLTSLAFVKHDAVMSPSIRADSVFEQPKKLDQEIPAAKTHTTSTQSVKPTFSLAAFRPRLGLTTGMASGPSWGIGPSAEFFLFHSLSVSTGLQISRYGAERSDHDTDFNRQTGQDFAQKYKAYLPGQYDRLDDIDIQTTALQLPARLNYYLPLRRQWSLFFSLGTLLNLSVYESVRFESMYQGAEHHTAFEVRQPSSVFQNFVLGSGIQYQHKRFVGQLSPVWYYNFRGVSDGRSQQRVGVNLSLLMDLAR